MGRITTEARAHLFKILDLAAAGEEVIIVHKEMGQKFIITPFKEKSSGKRRKRIERLAEGK